MKDEDGYYWIDKDGKKHREEEETDDEVITNE